MPFVPWVGIDATLTVPVDLQTSPGTNPVFGAGVTGDANNRVELRGSGTIAFGTGGSPPATTLARIAGPVLITNAGLDVSAAGLGLAVAEGANAKQGTAVLVTGTVTVANTSVTANSKIAHWRQVAGGTLGHLSIGTVTAGTSFVINSSSNTDTSTIGYEIFEPG